MHFNLMIFTAVANLQIIDKFCHVFFKRLRIFVGSIYYQLACWPCGDLAITYRQPSNAENN